eukprot:scaffold112428_cov30-Tisochrysis_lutea.AAC.1
MRQFHFTCSNQAHKIVSLHVYTLNLPDPEVTHRVPGYCVLTQSGSGLYDSDVIMCSDKHGSVFTEKIDDKMWCTTTKIPGFRPFYGETYVCSTDRTAAENVSKMNGSLIRTTFSKMVDKSADSILRNMEESRNAPPSSTENQSPPVVVYWRDGRVDRKMGFKEDVYNLTDHNLNDKISGIRVRDDCMALVYEHTNQRGAKGTLLGGAKYEGGDEYGLNKFKANDISTLDVKCANR